MVTCGAGAVLFGAAVSAVTSIGVPILIGTAIATGGAAYVASVNIANE